MLQLEEFGGPGHHFIPRQPVVPHVEQQRSADRHDHLCGDGRTQNQSNYYVPFVSVSLSTRYALSCFSPPRRKNRNAEFPCRTVRQFMFNVAQDRPIVYLTSRVHPGETSSSWVIDGVIEYLCGDTITARKARDAHVFKIVPMLNVEGVVNGW